MMLRALTLSFAAVLLTSCDSPFEEMNFPSQSMEPTIRAGSVVTVDTEAYEDAEPERFDIVVFVPPDAPESRYGFRLAGLPGEKVELADDGLRIDGALIKHPAGIVFQRSELGQHTGAVLGEDEYFVLGDNTSNARDSRHFGPISRAAIYGEITKIEQDAVSYTHLTLPTKA